MASGIHLEIIPIRVTDETECEADQHYQQAEADRGFRALR